jgi:hypothetical protein
LVIGPAPMRMRLPLAPDAARRRTDLRGNDLDRPDAVAHARGDAAERLAAALGAFARVADDLDDVFF